MRTPGATVLVNDERVDDVVTAVKLVQRRQPLALEPEQPVGVVLDHQHAVSAGELDQPPAAVLGQRDAGRVLEGGDRVHEVGGAGVERPLQRADVDSLAGQRHALDARAERPQRYQGAVVGRILDQRAPAPAEEQLLREERDPLQRAVDQQHAGCIHAVPLADPLAQRRIAAGRVRQRPGGVGREGLRRSLPQVVDRQHVGRRDAAGEGDLAHAQQSKQPYRRASAARLAASVGLEPTRMPRASSACFLPAAVPDEPEMMAPAWPIVLPGGAWKPAM